MTHDATWSAILARSLADRPPNLVFGDTSDAFWLWANTDGRREDPALATILPSFPDPETSKGPIGAEGEGAVRHGFPIYLTLREVAERWIGRLGEAGDVLEFGVGWGRMIRLFLRDVAPEHLWGTDVNGDLVRACRSTNRHARFVMNGATPPLPFEDGRFGFIYAYSVFSHLGEEISGRWVADLARTLAPGGLLVVSTWPRSFIEWCRDVRADPTIAVHPAWRRNLEPVFLDTERWLARYDEGAFCFDPYAEERHPRAFLEGVPSHGEACIPRAFVEREWTKHLVLRDYIDDRARCPQNLIVMQKP